MPEPVLATYHIRADASAIAARAQGIAVEQSVEMPLSAITDARVLAEVARESRTERSAEPWWRRLRWVPRLVAFAALAIVGVVVWNSGNATHRARLAQGAMELGTAATVPGIEAATLADFEVIRHIAANPKPEDDALILALAE